MSQRVHREPDISVVLAVGNHEDSIGHDIRCVAAHLRRLGRTFEILAVNSGSSDNSLSIAQMLGAAIPELRVIPRESGGRAFLRGSSEARGETLLLLGAGRRVSLAPLGWALSRLAAGRQAVVLRGRYVVARRLAALPVIVRSSGQFPGSLAGGLAGSLAGGLASGFGLQFEAVFERQARDLGIDVVGSRPRPVMPSLLRPVLRFLAA